MYPLRHEHSVRHEQIKILQIYIYKLLSNSFVIVAGVQSRLHAAGLFRKSNVGQFQVELLRKHLQVESQIYRE